MSSSNNSEHTATTHMGRLMIVAAWLVVLGLLTLFFSQWLDKQHNPNQEISSQMLMNGVSEVVLQRNRYGHYVATGRINDHKVELMLDTGATVVSIPAGLAQQLELPRGAPMSTMTASGPITTYATILDKVELGDIVLTNVRANINPYSDDVLLGMSFLKQLEFTQRGNTLTIRQYN
jgi:aspartyl protease family protein